MRWYHKAVLFGLVAAIPLIGMNQAHASTTVTWVPKSHYPCLYGAEWSLLPVDGITSATLHVDGVSYPMDVRQHWSYTVWGPITSWYAASAGRIDGDSNVTATFDGEAPNANLDIAACIHADTPTPTPPPSTSTTPPPTTPPTTTPPPTTHTTTTPPTPCCTRPPRRHTADTGAPAWPIAAGGTLLGLGTAAAWIARRRSAEG